MAKQERKNNKIFIVKVYIMHCVLLWLRIVGVGRIIREHITLHYVNLSPFANYFMITTEMN